ncbi:hypothetical protein NSA50_17035 [Clostridium sp. DSM 100503]|uniref:hypothetical protein n=1 Tax=Clostridium sp. DSM 100503 TaxID=2963282 RepID=UPI002149A2BA|nr:hypothetical protein [Clostridium sp. DSM 100503]MCR1952730.1 hypothetical protein [Clostridium sp. DSM 100503]
MFIKNYLESSPQKIVEDLFTGGLIFIASLLLSFISLYFDYTSEIGYIMSILLYIIATIFKYIFLIYIFRFISIILYKLLKLIDNKLIFQINESKEIE